MPNGLENLSIMACALQERMPFSIPSHGTAVEDPVHPQLDALRLEQHLLASICGKHTALKDIELILQLYREQPDVWQHIGKVVQAGNVWHRAGCVVARRDQSLKWAGYRIFSSVRVRPCVLLLQYYNSGQCNAFIHLVPISLVLAAS